MLAVTVLLLLAATVLSWRRPARGKVNWRRWLTALRWKKPVQPPSIGQVLVEVAAQLRAGASIEQAWQRALPDPTPPWADPVLAACGVQQRENPQPAAGAMAWWLRRHGRVLRPAADVEAAAAACRLARTTGAPLADVIDQVVAGIAEGTQAHDLRATALAGPRATARLLAWLPLAGLGLGLLLDADPLAVLMGGGAGGICLVAGLVLFIAGRRWVAVLVRRAEQVGQ